MHCGTYVTDLQLVSIFQRKLFGNFHRQFSKPVYFPTKKPVFKRSKRLLDIDFITVNMEGQ